MARSKCDVQVHVVMTKLGGGSGRGEAGKAVLGVGVTGGGGRGEERVGGGSNTFTWFVYIRQVVQVSG